MTTNALRPRQAAAVRGAPVPVPEIPHPEEIAPSLPFVETEHWYVCGPPAAANQGWKLYVPFTMHNARELTERLVTLVSPAQLQFKYVKNITAMRKLNSGLYGYPQIGKCFVIYFPEPEEGLLVSLKGLLAEYRDQCPAVPCGIPFGDELPLYYRYGSYRGPELALAGQAVADDRGDLANAVPDGVEDVLARHVGSVTEHPAIGPFLRIYPAFRALVQQGKCGVFHALDLRSETFSEVVLKVGYHRGQVQLDGSDGCSFLRAELEFYGILADRGLAELAPTLVDSLDVARKVILVLEYIDGTTLLTRKLAGTLTCGHLERAWSVLDRFHASDLFLGDAKLANFLLTDEGDLRIVDFEAGGVVGDARPPVRTFFLVPEPADVRQGDRLHFLASILFPYEEGRYSWRDRRFPIETWLRYEPRDDLSAWAMKKLRAEVSSWPPRRYDSR